MMKKQQKYRIATDKQDIFWVQELRNGTWCDRFGGGKGKSGLEACEEWIAKQE